MKVMYIINGILFRGLCVCVCWHNKDPVRAMSDSAWGHSSGHREAKPLCSPWSPLLTLDQDQHSWKWYSLPSDVGVCFVGPNICISLTALPLGTLSQSSSEACTSVSKDTIRVHLGYGEDILMRLGWNEQHFIKSGLSKWIYVTI